MRGLQFWILLLGSLFVSGLLIKQIFLERALDQERRVLVDSQETVSNGQDWQGSWQKLAADIYQAGPQDPAFVEIFKKENIAVHEKPAADAGPVAPTTSAAPPASSKTPATLAHPTTP